MRLGSLSLLCSESFLNEVSEQGPTTLRIKYPYSDIAVLIKQAKDLSVLIGYNAVTPVTMDQLSKDSDKITAWVRTDDILLIAAFVAAYQNQGGMIRGSAENFMGEVNLFKLRKHMRTPSFYNKITFEYLWRLLAGYRKDRAKSLPQHGPIEHHIQKFFDDGGGKEYVDMVDCFGVLNCLAEFKPYSDKKELERDAKRCGVFQTAWKNRVSHK